MNDLTFRADTNCKSSTMESSGGMETASSSKLVSLVSSASAS